MRVGSALLLCFATCSGVAAQQGGQAQSTTTYQSSITGSATTVTPAKYYIGNIDLSKLAGGAKDTKKSAECKASSQGSKLKSDLKLDEPYLLGEAPILVHATASDGCPVKLAITNGIDVIKLTSSSDSDGAAPAGSSGTTYMTLLKHGMATIHAVEEPPKAGVNPAPTADWNLTVEENASVCIPGLLPQKPPKKAKADDSSIVQYLGNPSPYSFQVVGERLLVYSAKERTENEKKTALEKFTQEVQGLLAAVGNASGPAGATAAPASTTSTAASATGSSASGAAAAAKPAYSVEVSVPHDAALGDLATRLNTVNYPDFTIQDVGSKKVRITSATLPNCAELTAFLRDLRDVAWKPRPENPVAKLFFLNASDVTGALGSGAAGPGAAGGPASGSPSSAPPGGATTTPGSGSTPGGATSPAAPVGAAPPAASSGAPTATPTQTSGGTTPPAATPAAATNTPGGAVPSSTSAPAGSTPGAAGSPSGAPQTPTVSGVGTDTLLFFNATPGDDAAVAERRRLVALLDLPRPVMIINVFALQTSSTDGRAVGKAIQTIHKHVDEYNDRIQLAVNKGWEYLRDQIATPERYFDLGFYKYLTARYVQDPGEPPPTGDLQAQQIAQRILEGKTGTPMPVELRNQKGICAADEYCLGYTNIFQPLKPRLTDLLVATIASKTARYTMNVAINRMENVDLPPAGSDSDCIQRDREGAKIDHIDHFYLECFRDVANVQFSAHGQPSPLGLLRAALANFLFEYKLSQIYPHEFDDYKLSQSAQTLNAELAPLVDAFNRDVAAYQAEFSKHVMDRDDAGNARWFGSEKPTFVNNGLISVRTISGFETTVSTTTQNFMDATQMPTVSALAQSITGAAPSTSGKPNVLQNISPIQAQVILGALAAYQSSKVQIGRTLSIDVTPRSLNGASSAELTVKINADESASPTYYSPTGSSTAADISRVANHDTSTRVRVESIKMFDVSTFTAVLEKSRTRFPIIPPLVEIPYIGTIFGWPLPPAKEYHSSMAVLSTIIVPTAADIALGLSFTSDRLVDSNGAPDCRWPGVDGILLPNKPDVHSSPCKVRRATSFSDLDSPAIQHYHKLMISCLANSMTKGYPSFDSNGNPAMGQCPPSLKSSALDTE